MFSGTKTGGYLSGGGARVLVQLPLQCGDRLLVGRPRAQVGAQAVEFCLERVLLGGSGSGSSSGSGRSSGSSGMSTVQFGFERRALLLELLLQVFDATINIGRVIVIGAGADCVRCLFDRAITLSLGVFGASRRRLQLCGDLRDASLELVDGRGSRGGRGGRSLRRQCALRRVLLVLLLECRQLGVGGGRALLPNSGGRGGSVQLRFERGAFGALGAQLVLQLINLLLRGGCSAGDRRGVLGIGCV